MRQELILNKYIFLGITYFYVTCMTLFFPASEGYEAIGWRLAIGQLWAIPITGLIFLLFWYILKKKEKDKTVE